MSPKLTPYEQMDAYAKAIYDQWVFEAVMTCAIQMPWPFDVEIICGYNPQRLLTYQPDDFSYLWNARHLEEMMGTSYAKMTEMMFPKEISEETIDFEPRYRTETVIVVGSNGAVVDIESHEVAINRKLAPFVMPVGRLVYDQSPRYQAINDMEAVVPRWGESDADPLRDIEDMVARMNNMIAIQPSAHGKTSADSEWVKFFLHADFSAVEMHALLATLRHETRGVILELDSMGGAIDGFADAVHLFAKSVAKCEPLPRHPDYHRHDPTKRHGTRGSMRRQRKSK